MSKSTVISIQILRGVAALLVAFVHLPPGTFPASAEIFRGAIGVDLFFIISGYIMAMKVDTVKQGFPTAIQFLQRRLLRIYPLYWIITTLFLLFWLNRGPLARPFIDYLYDYALIPKFAGGIYVFPVIGAGWSLSFELFFYLCLTFLLALRAATFFPISAAILSLVAIGWVFPVQDAVLNLVTSPLNLEFLFGVWIYSARKESSIASLRTLNKWSWLLLVAVIPFLLWVKTGTTEYSVDAYRLGTIHLPDLSFWPRWLAWGVPSAMALYGFLALEPRLQKYKTNSLLRLSMFFGNASYSLYLTHQLTIVLLGDVLGAPQTWQIIIYFLAMTINATLCFWLFERPLRNAWRSRSLPVLVPKFEP